MGSGQSAGKMNNYIQFLNYQSSIFSLLTFVAKFSFVAFHADTFTILTMSMAATIWHFTLLISDIAFFPLPSRLAQTFTIDVIPLPTA